MFKIVEKPEFTHTVHVMVPSDEGHEEQSFKGRFRVLPTSEIRDITSDAEAHKDLLREIWISASDLIGPDDRPLPWSDELKEALLDLPYVRGALLRTYMNAVSKARSGN